MKIEIDLTDEQAADFRIEHENLVLNHKETVEAMLQMIDRAITRQTIMVGDIVINTTFQINPDMQFIVRGLHAGIAWLWSAGDNGKWAPWGDAKLNDLTKFNQ